MPTAQNVLPETLMNSVLGKLYDILTNGDQTVPKSEDNFFSWSTPGIPFDEADFEFLTYGLTGVVKAQPPKTNPDGTTTEPTPPSPEELDKLRGEHTARLYMQAEQFARFVDVIPDASGINEQLTRMNIKNDEGSLSDVYDYVLRFSQVAQTDLTAEEKQKIAKFRELLQVEREKEDLLTGEKTKVMEPSPLVKVYNEKMQAWMDAALEYNNVRINALTASSPAAVHTWAMNANILRKKVTNALNDWINNGYKNEYEKIAAYIDQVSARDLSLLKAEYKDTLQRAKLTGLASGSDFYYTGLVPGNFYQSKGWTNFEFTSNDYSYYSKSTNNKWGGTAGLSLGLFSFGGSSGGSKKTFNSQMDSSSFRLSFQICQVPIVRPWFKLNFLNSKTWRFDQNNPESKGDFLSDGNRPPSRDSLMPAIPTAIVFIRNLYLHFGSASQNMSQIDKQVQGGGAVGFGPFFVGGSYKEGSSIRDNDYHSEGQGIRVPGLQAIGFKCHMPRKSPDPNPAIKKWI